ncbi:hypothetical protein C2845_PM02G09270 [Panicum miliaceum]|uniref:DUF1618 domain-containing protein n=1 Tax=Panicum miliaceum TaxID=4540 RepID=A0A3L6SBH8_PANMI|nr:hypothetical protein C2845_PM02G09270 [Panicum miliaceum]
MGLTRRFLSLIVDNRSLGAQSLRCMDLTRHKLFNTTPPDGNLRKNKPNGTLLQNKQATAATFKMDNISLPKPSFYMRASDFDLRDPHMHCFPAVERRVFCLDRAGRGFLLEADTSRMVMLPHLHKPKLEPISLYIPCDDLLDDLDGGGGGSLFIMDRVTKPELEADCKFEALVYRKPSSNFLSCSWDCDLLLPPPCFHDTIHSCLEISSYAVVKGGSQICISVDGVGTYCLDIVSYAWSEVGKWTLPFRCKVEYVPELKLWFGFSAKDQHLAAANLSTMDYHESQPQLLESWKEVGLPQGWQQLQDPQLVNLGSGRFCIARFLHTGTTNSGCVDESSNQNVTVLTGVEVAIARDFCGRLKLDMVKHKSRCHKSNCGEETITAVF